MIIIHITVSQKETEENYTAAEIGVMLGTGVLPVLCGGKRRNYPHYERANERHLHNYNDEDICFNCKEILKNINKSNKR